MKKMHVVPVEGRVVLDPERGVVLTGEGWEVPKTQYWMRRLSDGDVTTKQDEAPAGKKER
ncbi:DUF2635 domain-containing protein [Alcaligenes nematophilus]|nr:hypothetical protein ASL22_13290 [Alcaligenes faecalis]